MQSHIVFTIADVGHIAQLSNIPVTESEKENLAKGFTTTMAVIDELKKVQTGGIESTSQVTGLENVFREDIVDEDRMFSQEEALRNAKRTHNGFFVVDQVLEK